MNVIKRNGDCVPFDKKKISDAVNKAFIEVDGALMETDTGVFIADKIEDYLSSKNNVSVEEIQNLVEDNLMASGRKDVARAYIRYRYKREAARKSEGTFFDAIGEKLAARNVQNQNANVDERSFGGRIGEAASVMTKQYALDHLVSDMAKKNHLGNRIYIHDLDAYAVGSHNCLSIPFDDLLAKGFNTRQTDVRPAGSINTAFQLVAVIFQLQSLQQFGGVSATHLDWTMVPYVRKSFYKHYADGCKYIGHLDDEDLANVITYAKIKDLSIDDDYFKEDREIYQYAMDMTIKETHQAAEGMYHNLRYIWATCQ